MNGADQDRGERGCPIGAGVGHCIVAADRAERVGETAAEGKAQVYDGAYSIDACPDHFVGKAPTRQSGLDVVDERRGIFDIGFQKVAVVYATHPG
ncbi:hypothetical protein D3C80_1852270 [compost metagenome]